MNAADTDARARAQEIAADFAACETRGERLAFASSSARCEIMRPAERLSLAFDTLNKLRIGPPSKTRDRKRASETEAALRMIELLRRDTAAVLDVCARMLQECEAAP